ncbi:unnamed protein product [Urochloa decumbens]|uniref:Rhodanese domain-containing protein n=1 Tax=Urochloa decumbens TaxID=240449 RepID=A0ABC9DL66_9POAL
MAAAAPLLAQLPAHARCALSQQGARSSSVATRTSRRPLRVAGVRLVRLPAQLNWCAVDGLRSESEVQEAAARSVPARVAYELQLAGHRYLDVRTEGEFSAGHPQGAVNVPYMNKTGSGMTKNTHFLEQVSRIFGKDDEIIVGCQSGKRSLMAATELCSAGFTAVTDIAGGFSSWRQNGLPIIQ